MWDAQETVCAKNPKRCWVLVRKKHTTMVRKLICEETTEEHHPARNHYMNRLQVGVACGSAAPSTAGRCVLGELRLALLKFLRCIER